MIRATLLCASSALLLAACTSEVERAEKELTMVKDAHGSDSEICQASRKVAEAYLHDGDRDNYPLAKMSAATACDQAATKAALGL